MSAHPVIIPAHVTYGSTPTRVGQLTGDALKWAVAKAEHGDRLQRFDDWAKRQCISLEKHALCGQWVIIKTIGSSPEFAAEIPNYLEYAFAGPIMRRKGISTISEVGEWEAYAASPDHPNHKMTVCYRDADPVIAAMRCYVAATFGDHLDIPLDVNAPAHDSSRAPQYINA